jgi:hypothetical protein
MQMWVPSGRRISSCSPESAQTESGQTEFSIENLRLI